MLSEPRARQTAWSILGAFSGVGRWCRARERMVRRSWAKVVDLKRCLCERRVDSRVEMSVSDEVVPLVDKGGLGWSDSRLGGFFLRLRLGCVTVVQVLLFMVWVRAFWMKGNNQGPIERTNHSCGVILVRRLIWMRSPFWLKKSTLRDI